jgi:hypothetical protein
MVIRHKHYHEHDGSSRFPGFGITDFFQATLTRRVLCLALMAGAMWLFYHTTQYSFMWWISVVVFFVTLSATLAMLLQVALILLIIACVLGLIGYFIAHPW